jgi:uncharacterized protein (DUF4415 family)
MDRRRPVTTWFAPATTRAGTMVRLSDSPPRPEAGPSRHERDSTWKDTTIMPDRPRRHADPRDAAEAMFKKVTTKPAEPAMPRPAGLPNAREQVTLRIDRDLLEHFQAGGPGWQDRLNAALREAVVRAGGPAGPKPGDAA